MTDYVRYATQDDFDRLRAECDGLRLAHSVAMGCALKLHNQLANVGKTLYTTRQYPCGCSAAGPGDVPAYCSQHGAQHTDAVK